ncbi:MAG: hypothetical protein NVS2B12_00440 [Ktedonobacteraceae bacterium]
MFDPRLVTVFGILFVGLGIFNLVLGRNRMLQMRLSGPTLPWYRQIGILTGIEYILLGVVLLLNVGISSGVFSGSSARFVVSLYTIVLLLAALVLSTMLLQFLLGRRGRARPTFPAQTATIEAQEGSETSNGKGMAPEPKAESMQGQRERRQKTASARRRQSGRA